MQTNLINEKIARRFQYVRKKILNISQKELADKIGAHQVMISRFEQGKGGTIELLCKILDYCYEKNIQIHILFKKDFSYEGFLIELLDAANNAVKPPK